MLRIIQKGLIAPALLVASLGANAQAISENFQGWTEANLKFSNTTATTANETDGTCDPITVNAANTPGHGLAVAPIPELNLTKVYNGLSVTYNIVNGGVAPNCQPKGAYATATSPGVPITAGVSKGYVELNKFAAGSPAGTVGGSFTTSKIAHVETVTFTLSGTGTGRVAKAYTSTDGTTWVPLDVEVYIADKGGNVYEDVPVSLDNVQIRINSYDQIIRIHDFVVYDQSLGINDAWSSTGANVVVDNNKVTVSSPTSGSLEIVNMKGVVVAEKAITGGTESTFTIQEGGLYIVRLITNQKMATKKIMIQ